MLTQYGYLKIKTSKTQEEEIRTHLIDDTLPLTEISLASFLPSLLTNALTQIKTYEATQDKQLAFHKGAIAQTNYECREYSCMGNANPYVQRLGKTSDGTAIYVVDPKVLKANWGIELANGTHHYAHAFVPDGELWVLKDADIYSIEHEYTEYYLMKFNKNSYSKAHETALKREWLSRQMQTKLCLNTIEPITRRTPL
jgi:hypothetical protein